MRNKPMEDKERSLWIAHDETLYWWWKNTKPRIGKHEFIDKYRDQITTFITIRQFANSGGIFNSIEEMQNETPV